MRHQRNDIRIMHGIRRHLIAAAGLSVMLVAGFGGWAALAEIAGAVVAGGTVVVDSKAKKVQHQEGGIVRAIHVRDSDMVEVGDLLVLLDDTVTRANLKVVNNRLEELYAEQARLEAERDDLAEADFFAGTGNAAERPELSPIQASQAGLMAARRNSLDGRKNQLQDQIDQFCRKIEGYDAQKVAKLEEIALVEEELRDVQTLADKQLVTQNRPRALKRERARLLGEHGTLVSAIAETREAIGERRIQVLQIEEDARARILEKLHEVRSGLAQLKEQKVTAEYQLMRGEIRAPQSGKVHQLAVHTVGGVVSAAETILSIVPHQDVLVVEAEVAPVDIDQLSPGQRARIRLPSFDQRTTPELVAELLTVSPDLTVDPLTGLKYYVARLAIDDAELAKLNGKSLVPGMPVEVFVKTADRTVLSYLMKPLADQVAHAMTER